MRAKVKCNYDTNRNKLVDVLPLSSPYTVIIEITRLCNFKCFYCMHSTKSDPNGEYSKARLSSDNIDMELYGKIVVDLCHMNPHPKRVLILGLGEPLMNCNLPEMIKLLRDYGYEGRIDIITNASLMTNKWADNLINAGTSKIIISLQGLNAEDYKDYCGYNLNFEEFISNLQYLYDNRGKTEVYIKIIDSMLKTKEDKELFFDIFGSMCDSCNIEHLIVNQSQMGDQGVTDHKLNLHNEPIMERDICGMPFYQMQIFLDGTVLMCPVSGVSKELAIGDVKYNTLNEIWNGKKHIKLLKAMLSRKRYVFNVCKECETIHCISDERENIDKDWKIILNKLETKYEITD